jgi:hypothetical protein
MYDVQLLNEGTWVKNLVCFHNLTNFYPVELTLPYLYTAAYEFSIVQSSTAGHQMKLCSADTHFYFTSSKA